MSKLEIIRPPPESTGHRLRTRGVHGNDHTTHVAGPYELTLCGRELTSVNYYPREKKRETCLEDEKCCGLCAHKIRKRILKAQGVK